MYPPSSIFHSFIESLIPSSRVCVNYIFLLKKKKKKPKAISGQLRLQIKPNNYVASQVLQILAWIAYYNEAGGSGGPRPNSSVQIEEERAQVNQKADWRKTKRYFYSRPEEQLEVRTRQNLELLGGFMLTITQKSSGISSQIKSLYMYLLLARCYPQISVVFASINDFLSLLLCVFFPYYCNHLVRCDCLFIL